MKLAPLSSIFLLVAFAPTAGAQSAESFVTPGFADPAATATESADLEANPLLTQPSRYVGLDLDTYVQAISSSLSMRNRAVDPFGRNQDPEIKPVVPKAIRNEAPKYQSTPEVPFSEIISGIQVTTVIPGQQKFLVGERGFAAGSQINLSMNGKIIPVHVMKIRSSAITFRHGTTGELADLKLDIVPDGMSRGSAVRPPGVVPSGGNAPLELGSTTNLSSSR